MCLLGRFLIGLSDCQRIFMQTIMCMWFTTSQLPFAFGIVLFLIKIVRTTNDNVASMFYEATSVNVTPENGKNVNTNSLVTYFWIGFAVCIFSNMCSLILAQIHESVIDNETNSEVKEKKKELKRQAKSAAAQDSSQKENDDLL